MTLPCLSKALNIDSCRQGVERAAVAKLVAGKFISIKQCLLEEGFSEDQASNNTMQARVRRHVQKILRNANPSQQQQKPSKRMQRPPSCVTVLQSDHDDVSVLTNASGFHTTVTATTCTSNANTTTLGAGPEAMVPPLVIVTSMTHSIPNVFSPAATCWQQEQIRGDQRLITPEQAALLGYLYPLRQQPNFDHNHRNYLSITTPNILSGTTRSTPLASKWNRIGGDNFIFPPWD
jgi:hypothetical protein